MSSIPEQKWSVYLVECKDGSLYCGITTDINRRIYEHNDTNRGAKYTKARRPVSLVNHIDDLSKSTASKVEAFIKACPRKLKRRAISILTEVR